MTTTARPYIYTATGQKFFPFDPKPNTIDLTDIALGLVNKARFSGQTREFYSVAAHSVRVADVVKSWTVRPVVVLAALLHDAHEAYLADIPTPLKSFMQLDDGRTWRDVERGIQGAIHAKVGICVEEISAKEAALIKKADSILLQIEVEELFDKPTAAKFRKSLKSMPLVLRKERHAAGDRHRASWGFEDRLSDLLPDRKKGPRRLDTKEDSHG